MSGSSHTDVMLAGAAAAFTVDLLIYPLDTLKTRRQSEDFLKQVADPTKKNTRQLFRGLYQGIGVVVVSTLPAAGTFFTVYEATKSLLNRGSYLNLNLPQPLSHSVASAVAECASCLVLTPAEVIKQNAQVLQRQQHQQQEDQQKQEHGKRGKGGGKFFHFSTKSSTSLQALRQLGGAGGGLRLLSGYTALVARNLPFTSIQFPIFEFVRARLWARRTGTADAVHGHDDNGRAVDFGSREKRSLLETGVITATSAGLAGSFAAFITTPMDVVKTRMMLSAGRRDEHDASSGGSTSSSSSCNNNSSSTQGAQGGRISAKGKSGHSWRGLTVAREVVSERGVAGLFRGAVLRSVWTTVGSGLYLGMYEVAKAWLTRDKGGDDKDGFP